MAQKMQILIYKQKVMEGNKCKGYIAVGEEFYIWCYNSAKGYFSLSTLDETRFFIRKIDPEKMSTSAIEELIIKGVSTI